MTSICLPLFFFFFAALPSRSFFDGPLDMNVEGSSSERSLAAVLPGGSRRRLERRNRRLKQTFPRVYLQSEAACSQEVSLSLCRAPPPLTSHTASLKGALVGTQDLLTCALAGLADTRGMNGSCSLRICRARICQHEFISQHKTVPPRRRRRRVPEELGCRLKTSRVVLCAFCPMIDCFLLVPFVGKKNQRKQVYRLFCRDILFLNVADGSASAS